MKKNREKAFIFVAFTACMLILSSCGESEEGITADETNKDVEELANDIQETTAVEKADLEEVEETGESITEEEGVPWDDMSPVNINSFPAGITGSVDKKDVFFPAILFPSEYTAANGNCCASLGGKDYNAYAYVESHARTIADGGESYFEQTGDYIIHIKDSVKILKLRIRLMTI